MTKSLNIKALVLSAILMVGMVLPLASNAQGTDLFFRGGDDDVYSDRASGNGITIEGMGNEDPTHTPIGSGLLVLVAAGAGYAVMRRRKAVKKGTMLMLAFAILISMTQCKKKAVPTNNTNTVLMTLETTCGGGSRTVFEPEIGGAGSGTAPGFTWNADGYEYVSVGGSIQGYLGELRASSNGGNAQNRIVFSGNITAPQENEKVYFFYLGNGSHSQASGTATSTIDLSNQPNGTTESVTDFLVAIDEGEVWKEDDVYYAYADLKVKIAIAYFNLNSFVSPSTYEAETINLHGDALYSTATINYKDGTITGNQTGNINMGTNGEKYVALIASTNDETVLQFDSNSNHGEITFCNGIKERKFYSDELSPLPVYGALPGLFSVSSTNMVRFSPGNLQYTRHSVDEPWSTGNWSFMEHQYDIVEKTNEAIEENYANKTTISLFGWGCTGEHDVEFYDQQMYYMPYNTDAVILYQGDYYTVDDNYGPTGIDWSTSTITAHGLSVANHSDWGWCIGGEDSPWRTLTGNEWSWLLGVNNGKNGYSPNPGTNCRYSSTIGSTDNARYTKAKIITTNETVYGWVVFPDVYEHPSTAPTLSYINYQDTNATTWECDVIPIEAWNAMEAAGAVFLPAAGTRDCLPNSNTVRINSVGYDLESGNNNAGGNYWSSSPNSYAGTRILNFDHKRSLVYGGGRANGASVRLVRDAGSSN